MKSEKARIQRLIVSRACDYRDRTAIAEQAALELETEDNSKYTAAEVDRLFLVAKGAEEVLFAAIDALREYAAQNLSPSAST